MLKKLNQLGLVFTCGIVSNHTGRLRIRSIAEPLDRHIRGLIDRVASRVVLLCLPLDFEDEFAFQYIANSGYRTPVHPCGLAGPKIQTHDGYVCNLLHRRKLVSCNGRSLQRCG